MGSNSCGCFVGVDGVGYGGVFGGGLNGVLGFGAVSGGAGVSRGVVDGVFGVVGVCGVGSGVWRCCGWYG